jgi:predicted metal-dependent peptidase
MNDNLTAEQRILRERTNIMRNEKFIAMAGVMMIGKWQVRDDIPTACTNGRDVFYGRKFIESLDTKILRFTILHEYYHIMLMHMTMWKHLWDEDPQTANMAADYVINGMLDNHAKDFLTIWPHACLDHQYDGLDTGEVYRRLKQNANQNPRAANGGEAQDFDQHDTKGEGVPGLNPLTQEEIKALKHQIDSAIRQGAQFAGRMGADRDRALDGLLEAIVPWQEVLQDFIKTVCSGDDMATWRKPSRRWMARDLYMPTRYSESVKRISIGVDTSGSIGDRQLQRALSEVMGACETVHPEIVDVIYWDADVTAHEIYEGDQVQQLAESTKPKGGGGTRVGAMLDYMKAKDIRPDCIIIFTDGYVESDWGGDSWPAPVLWCVSTKGIVAPFGKTLYVPAGD